MLSNACHVWTKGKLFPPCLLEVVQAFLPLQRIEPETSQVVAVGIGRRSHQGCHTGSEHVSCHEAVQTAMSHFLYHRYTTCNSSYSSFMSLPGCLFTIVSEHLSKTSLRCPAAEAGKGLLPLKGDFHEKKHHIT